MQWCVLSYMVGDACPYMRHTNAKRAQNGFHQGVLVRISCQMAQRFVNPLKAPTCLKNNRTDNPLHAPGESSQAPTHLMDPQTHLIDHQNHLICHANQL